MKVLIIEDEAPAFRRLQRILEAVLPTIEILEVLDTVSESIKWFKNNSAPDLIFMDIQLADGLSFEIFESVEIKSPIIFTTAYDEYAIKAFKVNSIDYLLKPIEEEKLRGSLNKLKEIKKQYSGALDLKNILKEIQPEKQEYKTRFLVKTKQKLISIKATEINYFFSENGINYIYDSKHTKYVYDKPLDQIEEQLNPENFYRLNRQCLSNIEAISAVHPFDKGKMLVDLIPKTNLPTVVSRDKASDFKKWLG
jgi:DNA-binding LytR/AlgR family response regulator